jgi:hypothetical protein
MDSSASLHAQWVLLSGLRTRAHQRMAVGTTREHDVPRPHCGVFELRPLSVVVLASPITACAAGSCGLGGRGLVRTSHLSGFKFKKTNLRRKVAATTHCREERGQRAKHSETGLVPFK